MRQGLLLPPPQCFKGGGAALRVEALKKLSSRTLGCIDHMSDILLFSLTEEERAKVMAARSRSAFLRTLWELLAFPACSLGRAFFHAPLGNTERRISCAAVLFLAVITYVNKRRYQEIR